MRKVPVCLFLTNVKATETQQLARKRTRKRGRRRPVHKGVPVKTPFPKTVPVPSDRQINHAFPPMTQLQWRLVYACPSIFYARHDEWFGGKF